MTTVPFPGPGSLNNLAFAPIVTAIKALYGIATDVNAFIDKHIEEMKASANPTVSRTGRVLEMAKLGFGLAYVSSVTIIAVGQFLLGNTLAALSTMATAATLSNPIAMACAAIGAIVYGWTALSDQERNDILAQLSSGLEIGIQLIKSIIAFVIAQTKEMFDSKFTKDLKAFISDQAALFGRSLSDVTHLTVDMISDAGLAIKRHANIALEETRSVAVSTSTRVGEVLTDATTATGNAMSSTVDAVGETARRVYKSGKEMMQRVEKAPKLPDKP
ncbi:hypothetical protein [Rhizobacter fulvus]